jgi:glucosamine kinase
MASAEPIKQTSQRQSIQQPSADISCQLMSLFLAIDAGGTKTRCLLADETKILGRAVTGSVKLMRVGEEEASARLRAMLAEVASSANVSLSNVTRTCIGLAGYTIEAVREWAQREIAASVGGSLQLSGDEEIAFEGAFRGGPGILVVAGTGNNVMGRAADGAIYTAGGWGPVLGDEGSGYWIAQEALRAGFWARDRGIPTTLLSAIGDFWQLKTIGEIVEMANSRPGPDFPALTPIVVKCAEAGDELAIAVLERAGAELADLIALVALKMEESGPQTDIRVAYIGSVLEHITLVRASTIASLKKSTPHATLMEGAVDALDGALWRARNVVESA